MDSKARIAIRSLDQLLIRLHNFLNEGRLAEAVMTSAAYNTTMGLILKSMRAKQLATTEEFLYAIEDRTAEFEKYLQEISRQRALLPPPPPEQPVESLYEIVVGVEEQMPQGFTVLLTPEDVEPIKERFKNPLVSYSLITNISQEGASFADLMTELKGEKPTRSNLTAVFEMLQGRDPSASPYLVTVAYKPKFFGLIKKDTTGGFAWLTPEEASQVDQFLQSDPKVNDFQLLDFTPNVTKEELLDALNGLGI